MENLIVIEGKEKYKYNDIESLIKGFINERYYNMSETEQKNELEKKAREENADICIFGHTHREYLVEKDGTVYVNPGALQDKKYVIYDGRDFIQKVLD